MHVLDYKRQQNVLKRFDEDMLTEKDSIKKSSSQLYELTRRDNYDGNDPLDIEYFLKNRRIQNTAASKIQGAVRRTEAIKQKITKENTQAAMLEDTTRQYEQLSEQYTKTQAGGILKPKVKILDKGLFVFSNMRTENINKDI